MFNGLHYLTFSCQFSLLSVCLGYDFDRGPLFSWRMLWSWHHLAPISPSLGCWVKIAAHSSYFICGALPAAPVISLDYNKKLEILSRIKCSLHPASIESYTHTLQYEVLNRYNMKGLHITCWLLSSNYVIILSRSSSSLSGRTIIHHYDDHHYYHYHYWTFIHSIVVLSLKGPFPSYLV